MDGVRRPKIRKRLDCYSLNWSRTAPSGRKEGSGLSCGRFSESQSLHPTKRRAGHGSGPRRLLLARPLTPAQYRADQVWLGLPRQLTGTAFCGWCARLKRDIGHLCATVTQRRSWSRLERCHPIDKGDTSTIQNFKLPGRERSTDAAVAVRVHAVSDRGRLKFWRTIKQFPFNLRTGICCHHPAPPTPTSRKLSTVKQRIYARSN